MHMHFQRTFLIHFPHSIEERSHCITFLLIIHCRFIIAGLHLRSIEEPNKNRMPAEQGGTERCNDNIGSRSVVLLPTCQTSYEYDAEFSRIESWLDENPEFVQDYFIR